MRRFILALLFACFSGQALAVLAIDGTGTAPSGVDAAIHSGCAAATCAVVNNVNGLTTTGTGIVIGYSQAEAVTGQPAPVCSGTCVADAAGLTWHIRTTSPSPCTYSGGQFTANNTLIEFWAFSPGTLTIDQITVTWTSSGTIDDATFVVMAVKGFTGTNWQTNPFDSNASLGKCATTTTNTAPTVTGISTSVAADMLLFGVGSANNGPFPLAAPSTPAGWTNTPPGTVETATGGGTNGAGSQGWNNVVAATQSSITIATATSVNGWAAIADALTIAGTAAAGGSDAPMTLTGVGQ